MAEIVVRGVAYATPAQFAAWFPHRDKATLDAFYVRYCKGIIRCQVISFEDLRPQGVFLTELGVRGQDRVLFLRDSRSFAGATIFRSTVAYLRQEAYRQDCQWVITQVPTQRNADILAALDWQPTEMGLKINAGR